MKKYILIAVVACLAGSAWAAEMPKQGVGIQIGWAQPTLRLNSPSTAYPKDSLVDVTRLNGFKVGVVYDATFIKGFGSSLGINYTFGAGHTNWRSNGTLADYPRSRTQTLYHEIEVFVDWQYKFEVAKETYLILYSGPTIQIGAAFDVRTDKQQLPGGEVESSSIQRFNQHEGEASNNDLKRLNVTWGIGAGFQYQRYFLRGGYDFGLITPYANTQFINAAGTTYDRNTRGRLDQWSVKVGIYLWYHK